MIFFLIKIISYNLFYQALWYLSKASKDHKALLKHPAVSSFLWLKWRTIYPFFKLNLVLYLAFVFALTGFIFLRFGGFHVQVILISTYKIPS